MSDVRNKILNDVSQLVSGLGVAAQGVREELAQTLRSMLDSMLAEGALVTREEFDALRTRHEAVAARLSALEAQIPREADSPPVKPARRKTAKATKAAATKAKK